VLSTDGGSVAALEKLGVTVLYEPAADNLAQAYDEIRQLGSATGHAPAAKKVLRGMQQKITKLIQSVPKKSRHVKVFHEISPDYYSATSATFIGQIYKLFGFANIADAADGAHTGFPQLSAEYIVAQSPALVVLADSTCCAQTAATVAQRPGWQNIAAVKQHRVIAVNDDIAARWGPRVVKLVEIVANAAKKP
jgi:iron complex transport system substrate-binding protein